MSEDQKKRIRKIGSVCTAQERNEDGSDRLYLKVDNYYGQLLFLDKKENRVYEVKSAGIRNPYNQDAPDYVQKDVTINLDNPKASEPQSLELFISKLMAVADMDKLKEILAEQQAASGN